MIDELDNAKAAIDAMREALAERDNAIRMASMHEAKARRVFQTALPPLPDGWEWLVEFQAHKVDVRVSGPGCVAWVSSRRLIVSSAEDAPGVPPTVVDALWSVAGVTGDA